MTTILLVDDEDDIVLLGRLNLEMDGHRVVTANDGIQALEQVESERPDVIVLDLMMPGLDGWGVIERIKAHPDDDVRTIPVLLLTALSGPMDRVRGGIEGAVRYLVKPFDPDDLRQAVNAALAGEPEPVQRRRAQALALELLARMEGNRAPDSGPDTAPRPHLTRLEHRPAAGTAGTKPSIASGPPDLASRVSKLTDRQRELLETVEATSSIAAAADALGVSRSNVYASLRRIDRRLGTRSVAHLLDLLHSGAVITPRER